MAVKHKIGAYVGEDGKTIIQLGGGRGELLELLAMLNAKFLLEATSSPEEYQRVFNRLQVETGKNYSVLLADTILNKENDQEEFLGGKI